MQGAQSDPTHVPDSAYVFLAESIIFLLLLIGALNADGMPILPVVVMTGLLLCVGSLGVALLGVKLGVSNNKNVLWGNGASIVLSGLQVGLQHGFGLVANFFLFVLTLASDGSDSANAYFSIFFRANITQPDLWYLSRSAAVVMLGIALALMCLILATFSIIRQSIPGKTLRRAHFMGYVNSFVFLNISIQFVMKSANIRVCQKETPCTLSSFTEDPAVDWPMHVQVGLVLGVLLVVDFFSEMAYGKMLARDMPTPSGVGGYLFLFLFVVCRMSMLGSIVIFYVIIPDDNATDLFPAWFNWALPIGYAACVLIELVTGITEALAVHKRNTSSSQSSQPIDEILRNQKSRFAPTVLFGTSQRKTLLRSERVAKKVQ